MVATRSNSRDVPALTPVEEGVRSKRMSRPSKMRSKGGTTRNSTAVVSESKRVKGRQKRATPDRMKTRKKLENVDVPRRGRKITIDKSVGCATKEVGSNLICESEVVESVGGIEPHCSPVKVNEEEGENKWEDFGNTSEEDDRSTVVSRTRKLKRRASGKETSQDPEVRRSVRISKRKNDRIEKESSVHSSSSSVTSDDSEGYVVVKNEDSEYGSEEGSTQTDVESHGSGVGNSKSSGRKRNIPSSRKSSGHSQIKRSKMQRNSDSTVCVKSNTRGRGGSEAKTTSKTPAGTRAFVSKPLKPWQKANETIVVRGVVVPPRELRKGEKKMLRFRILAATLALGRSLEMTEDEGNEIVQQMRAVSERKQRPLQSLVTRASHQLEESESSEDEWEEMELADVGDSKAKNVQVMLEKSEEKDWWALYLRQEVNKCIRSNWENSHKVNILCYIGHLQYLKKIVLEENLIPSLMLTKVNLSALTFLQLIYYVFIEYLLCCSLFFWFSVSKWFCRYDATARCSAMVDQEVFENDADRAALLFAQFVAMGCIARICVNPLPIPRKWDEVYLIQNTMDELAKMRNLSTSTITSKQVKLASTGKTVSRKKSTPVNERDGMVRNYWVEYWDNRQTKWICVDPLSGTVADPNVIEENLTTPVLYIFAIDNEGGVREVTARYASDFSRPDFRRRRTDPKWLADTLKKNVNFATNRYRSKQEDMELRLELVKKPLPTTLSEYKNHPLYVLEKDLLKFEGIYPMPKHQIPLGEVRGHKVYPRSTVYTLQSANNWIKMARSVKEGEKPYKVVKARPKLNVPSEQREQRYLDVFGYWQTEPYRPPKVTNGRIPCNEFGNVYMYQPSMCPIGAVHLRLPGLPSIARRLGGLQCVPAVVGWDFNSCANFPIMEGACVLEEDAEKFVNEWKRLESSRKERENKRREERVLGNWRKLIRGILRHQYLKTRFG
ncbi:hypothetical protein Angca_005134, partial [Angiostrongylus cantonensis]